MKNERTLTGYPSIDKPWLRYYNEEAINAPLPDCTIYEYLWENNKDHLDDIAIIFFNRKITYADLFNNISRCEKALLKLGVKENEIVTIALPSIPEVLYLVYAVNKIGAVANMIHPLAGENEIIHYLNEVKSSVCFLFRSSYDVIKNSIEKTFVRTAVIVSVAESFSFAIKQLYKIRTSESNIFDKDNVITWTKFLKGGKGVTVSTTKKNCNTAAIISHTGGTTGEPKGVICSDKNINTVIWEIGCNFEFKRQEVMMAVLPPFINYSLVNSMLEPLAFGFKTVLIPKYEPDKFDEYIEKYKPNHINSIPAYWEALLTNEQIRNKDMSSLIHLFYGGEGMDEKTENAVNALLASCGVKNKLAKGLGSTEMVSAATAAYDNCNLPGSVGVPLVKVNCKIIDVDTGAELSYNMEGEVCFSGPQLMLGYYENKEATNEIIKVHKDGNRWIHTGDLGYINEDGVLFICGRIKRIFMTKGKDGLPTKMFPARIEKAILQHPAVSICCVIGVADEIRINYPKAFVVLNDDKLEHEKITKEITELCLSKLPKYMLPEEIEYWTDLPRTMRGKVDYRALEREVWKNKEG